MPYKMVGRTCWNFTPIKELHNSLAVMLTVVFTTIPTIAMNEQIHSLKHKLNTCKYSHLNRLDYVYCACENYNSILQIR